MFMHVYKTQIFKDYINKQTNSEFEELEQFLNELAPREPKIPYKSYVDLVEVETDNIKKEVVLKAVKMASTGISRIYQKWQKMLSVGSFHVKQKDGSIVESDKPYIVYRIPKRNKPGKFRTLANASIEVREIHKDLKENVLDLITAIHNGFPQAAQAFIEGRSIYTNVELHEKAKIHLSMDIANFFPSCTVDLLKRILPKIYGYCFLTEEEIDKLVEMVTYEGSLPQGTIISPMLSNTVAIPLDYIMINRVRGTTITYTRYADDISLTSKYRKALPNKDNYMLYVDEVQKEIDQIYDGQIKFNPEKVHLQDINDRLMVTGINIVVDPISGENKASIGKRKKAMRSKLLQLAILAKSDPDSVTAEEVYSVQGEFAFLNQFEPKTYTSYINNVKKAVKLETNDIFKYLRIVAGLQG